MGAKRRRIEAAVKALAAVRRERTTSELASLPKHLPPLDIYGKSGNMQTGRPR